jgi:membrane protease subunit HflK
MESILFIVAVICIILLVRKIKAEGGWDLFLQKLVRRFQYGGLGLEIDFRRRMRKFLFWALGLVFLLYLLSGIYIVQPDELGVVQTFGREVGTRWVEGKRVGGKPVPPGIHYHLPWPIQKVTTPKVAEVKRIEIGFRTLEPGPPAKYDYGFPEESLMLTGDENIVDIDFIVQYKIKNPSAYLFNVKDIEETLKDVSESAMREVVGRRTIDEVLTVGRGAIQNEVCELIQKIMDKYEAGVKIVLVQLQDVHPPAQVRDAFKDVASAREDKNKTINEAYGYREKIVPQARGEAKKLIKEAEAYREQKIKKAKGDAERFAKILSAYRRVPQITEKRLYIETLEEILPKVKKIIIDEEAKGLLKLLNLQAEEKKK